MKKSLYSLQIIFLLIFIIRGAVAENAGTRSLNFPPPLPCGLVTNISVSNITSSTVEIAWDAVPGAVKYNVGVRIIGEMDWMVRGTDINQIKLSNLAAGSEYEVRVRTICDAGSGYRKNSTFATGPNFTTLGDCYAPDKLTTNDITSNSALAAWIGVDNGDNYVVRIKPVSGNTWTTYFVSGGKTTFHLTGLSAITDYEWQVRARCTSFGQTSAWSLSELFTTQCGQVEGISVGNITSSSAVASWSSSDAYQYRLRRRAVGDIDWVYSSVFPPSSERKFTNLLPNTEYEFQVQSYCNAQLTDSSGYFSGTNFTTGNGCLAPASLSTSNITDASAQANWNTANDASSYRVRIRKSGDVSWNFTVVKGGGSTSYTFTGLESSTDYEWQARTICSSIEDYSGFEQTISFTTNAAARLESAAASNSIAGIIALYPNPSKGQVQLEMNTGNNHPESVTVEIFNTLGQSVYAGNLVSDNGYINGRISLDENVQNGMYFLRVLQGNNAFETHFIINK